LSEILALKKYACAFRFVPQSCNQLLNKRNSNGFGLESFSGLNLVSAEPISKKNKVSSTSEKFEEMVSSISIFSFEDIESIRNVRKRELLRGILVGLQTQEVLVSFQILYEDYLPLRGPGQFVFRQIRSYMETSIVSAAEIGDEASFHFTLEESNKKIVQRDMGYRKKLSELFGSRNDSIKDKEVASFDFLLENVLVWELEIGPRLNQISNERTRRIISGCFVGAHTPEIVQALKILYEDYLPLRWAGNFIFSVMKRMVSASNK